MSPKVKISLQPTNYRKRIWFFMADKGNCMLFIVALSLPLVFVSWGIITNDHKHGFSNNRNEFSHSSGGQKSKASYP